MNKLARLTRLASSAAGLVPSKRVPSYHVFAGGRAYNSTDLTLTFDDVPVIAEDPQWKVHFHDHLDPWPDIVYETPSRYSRVVRISCTSLGSSLFVVSVVSVII